MNRHDMGKYLIRKAFAGDHILPDEILWRQKAAFSDAVGHSMVNDLKALAERTYSDSEFRERAAGYAYRPPFTKESLLYRELFERFYPGQARPGPAATWTTPPPECCPTTARAVSNSLYSCLLGCHWHPIHHRARSNPTAKK